MLSPNVTVSMESAITSRLTSDAFIPSVPIDMPSLMVMVPNMKGTLFASRSPSLTLRAWRFRCTLQGVTSEARLLIATNGFSISSSSSPVARNIARAAARSGPSVTILLFFFRSTLTAVVICSLRGIMFGYRNGLYINRWDSPKSAYKYRTGDCTLWTHYVATFTNFRPKRLGSLISVQGLQVPVDGDRGTVGGYGHGVRRTRVGGVRAY